MTSSTEKAERLPDWPEVVARLNRAHGAPSRDPLPLGNKADPYDELIYILLTVMTRSQPRIDRAYRGLAELCDGRGWSALLEADDDRLRDILRPLGFLERRRMQLLAIAARVEEDWGGSLQPLQEMSDDDALAFLTGLPGVGEKTAKCVLMYSLRRRVMPVDIHVLRVGKRLGLIDAEATWSQSAEQLEAGVPDELKFDAHVQLVVHGRSVCTSVRPDCDRCCLATLCPSSHVAAARRAHYVRA